MERMIASVMQTREQKRDLKELEIQREVRFQARIS
jgi:hypothetical protein